MSHGYSFDNDARVDAESIDDDDDDEAGKEEKCGWRCIRTGKICNAMTEELYDMSPRLEEWESEEREAEEEEEDEEDEEDEVERTNHGKKMSARQDDRWAITLVTEDLGFGIDEPMSFNDVETNAGECEGKCDEVTDNEEEEELEEVIIDTVRWRHIS